MCTFSSSAQHDIVYLYYDVSIKCTLLFSVVGYIIGFKVQCNSTLGDYHDCYCSSNWTNSSVYTMTRVLYVTTSGHVVYSETYGSTLRRYVQLYYRLYFLVCTRSTVVSQDSHRRKAGESFVTSNSV